MNIYSTPAHEIFDAACELEIGESMFVHSEGDEGYDFVNEEGTMLIYDWNQKIVAQAACGSELLNAIVEIKGWS